MRMPTSTKDKSIVKIAVERKPFSAQLIEFDQSEPLGQIIKNICGDWGLDDDEQYALQFSDNNTVRYVTEKNRIEVKNGSILQLDYAASKTVADIVEKLSKPPSSAQNDDADEISAYEKLMLLSSDSTFAVEFLQKQGITLIVNLIENGKLIDTELAHTITSLVDLMDHGIVSWDILELKFILHIVRLLYMSSSSLNQSVDNSSKVTIIKGTLQILENIVLNGGDKYQEIESEISIKNLLKLLETFSGNTHKMGANMQNVLALLNALILKANSQKKKSILSSFDFRPIQSILGRHGDNIGREMAHQLYVLQQLILNLFKDRMLQKMDVQDVGSLEKIKELRKIAFESDQNGFFNTLTSNDNVIVRKQFAIKDYKKMGFKCDINPVLDFTETPPGMLALDCMLYFANHHADQYTKIVIENSCRADEHECPFGQTSIELVKLLCDVFRIGEPPNEQGENYVRMFFSHDHPFEEIFSVSINLVNKTWREMKATVEDFVKVFSVVREQITRALQSKPNDLEHFRIVLKTLSYNEIIKIWQQERNTREEWESHAKPIIELKEQITPEILELIQQRRLNFLCEGTRFIKYNNRGQRIKDKFWFIKLSSNHKVFHYGDCDEIIIPTTEELNNKLAVNDIKSLVIGKECPHMKDSKGRKGMHQLAFSLILDSAEMSSLNFVAQSDQVFTYWTDGINALLGQKMVSNETESDLKALLSMEIKLRLLDVEGIDIPQEPPPVPEEPLNYDYYFSSNI